LGGGTFDFNTLGPAAPQATPSGTGLNPLIGIDFKPGTGDVQFVSEFDPTTREVRIVDKAAPGTVEEILARMKGAEQKSPSLETERMWVQAREMVNKNQLSEALTLFTKMREANPKDVRAQVGEGIVYLRRKDYKLALGTLEYAVRSDPKMEDAYWFLAQTHLALENPSAALEDYGALLRLNPDNAEALMSRLSLLYSLRRYSELIADANKLISLRPTVPEGYLYRGVGYLLTSRASEGQKDFEQAVRVGLSKDVEKILRPRFFPVVP
jgi:tetratricopeptide (TPR) repeat protein